MRTLLSLLLAATAGGCQLLGQQSAPAPAPVPAQVHGAAAAPDGNPAAAQVLKLLDLLQVEESLRITLDGVKKQMRNGAEEQFRDKVPNPTPEQLKAIQGIVDDVFSGISAADMIKDVVPVYQRHLTKSDVRALIAFYTSPAGRKILREQPAMIRESMQATSAGQQKKMETVLAKLDLRMQQLIEHEQGKGDPAKK